jgi:hypothetical protein
MVSGLSSQKFLKIFVIGTLVFSNSVSAHGVDSSYTASTRSFEVETNFYSLLVNEYLTPGVESQVVASIGNIFFVADRHDRVIRQMNIKDGGIESKQFARIPEAPQFAPENAQRSFNFVLDLLAKKDSLFVLVANGAWDRTSCGQAIVYKYSILDFSSTPKKIFSSSPCLSGSLGWNGRLALDDDYLYVAGGDLLDNYGYGYFPSEGVTNFSAGDKRPKTNYFGAVSKISQKTGKSTLMADGIRNLGGLYKDSKSGFLYESENGPRGGDEINIIQQGKNYGWPQSTLGRPYDSQAKDNSVIPNSILNSTPPIFGWTPSISPSTITRYGEKGIFSKYWKYNLLVGSLKDESLHRLYLSKDGKKVIYDERINLGVRIRSFTVLKDGHIVLSTDNSKILIVGLGADLLNGTFPKL